MDANTSDYLDLNSILPRRTPTEPGPELSPSAAPANNPEAAQAARAKIAALIGQPSQARPSGGVFDIKQLKNPASQAPATAPIPAPVAPPEPSAPQTLANFKAPTQGSSTPPATSVAVPAATKPPVVTSDSWQLPEAHAWHVNTPAPSAETLAPVSPAISPAAPAVASPRKTPSRLRPILTALASFALLFAVFKAPVFLNQLRFTFDKPAVTEPVEPSSAALAATHDSPTIEIPKINVSAPVVFEPSIAEEAVQKGLQNGVVHYGISVKPGQAGNSVIVGHSSNDWWEPGNYKFVFVLLDKLIVGDTFSVDYDGKKYIYEVYESKVVEPTDISVLAHTENPTMTLITCTPPGTSWKRLVIKAKQISPDPGKVKPIDPKVIEDDPGLLPSNAPGLGNQLQRLWDNIRRLFGANIDGGPAEGDPAGPSELPSGL